MIFIMQMIFNLMTRETEKYPANNPGTSRPELENRRREVPRRRHTHARSSAGRRLACAAGRCRGMHRCRPSRRPGRR